MKLLIFFLFCLFKFFLLFKFWDVFPHWTFLYICFSYWGCEINWSCQRNNTSALFSENDKIIIQAIITLYLSLTSVQVNNKNTAHLFLNLTFDWLMSSVNPYSVIWQMREKIYFHFRLELFLWWTYKTEETLWNSVRNERPNFIFFVSHFLPSFHNALKGTKIKLFPWIFLIFKIRWISFPILFFFFLYISYQYFMSYPNNNNNKNN